MDISDIAREMGKKGGNAKYKKYGKKGYKEMSRLGVEARRKKKEAAQNTP